jgi:FKBP-type peptidyl-prolyl cis-trans isomerase FkpA
MRRVFAFTAAIGAVFLAACEPQGKSVMDELKKREATRTAEFEAAAAKSAKFLEDNKKVVGVQVTPSGLQYKVVRAADPSLRRPTARSEVTVNYEGKRIDGKIFDSSYKRGEPAEFPLNRVIPGWTEGVQLMRPGEEFQFVIPAELAYGANAPPDIGPNQTLIFRVELLSFKDEKGRVVTAATK